MPPQQSEAASKEATLPQPRSTPTELSPGLSSSTTGLCSSGPDPSIPGSDLIRSGLDLGGSGSVIRLSVIVPARNEQESIAQCLKSLLAQSEPGWQLGRDWELIVVNDGSTDQTQAIARELLDAQSGARLIEAGELPAGWMGKSRSCAVGAEASRGAWLLFTDADTIHAPGRLSIALTEAERHRVAMLSYVPLQLVDGVVAKALMALIFAELASAYPLAKVNRPESPVAAANGQFLLVRREAYQAMGGHGLVRKTVLEDLMLAREIKRRKLGLRFRYAPEAVSARMYRSLASMRQGWIKNLAQLFPKTLPLALARIAELFGLVALPIVAWVMAHFHVLPWYWGAVLLLWLRSWMHFGQRIRRSRFSLSICLLAPITLPLFAVLLVQSWWQLKVKARVQWKGRVYTGTD